VDNKPVLATEGAEGRRQTQKELRTGQQSDPGVNSANGEDTAMTEDSSVADALQMEFTIKIMVQVETTMGKQYTLEQLERHGVGDIPEHVTDVEVWCRL
jgi:hypothetical protein